MIRVPKLILPSHSLRKTADLIILEGVSTDCAWSAWEVQEEGGAFDEAGWHRIDEKRRWRRKKVGRMEV
jgi:hypothetical protein